MVATIKQAFDSPEKYISYVAKNTNLPTKLSDNIRNLNALMNDMGENMNKTMQDRWLQIIDETQSQCEDNSYNLSVSLKNYALSSLKALEGRYYEIIEKDFQSAGNCFEQAAILIDEVQPVENFSDIIGTKLENGFDDFQYLYIDFALLRMPNASMWDWAGDAYFKDKVNPENVRRCYEKGIQSIKDIYLEVVSSKPGDFRKSRGLELLYAHLSLTLADLLLEISGNESKSLKLYREATDAVFFKQVEKSNEQYHHLCNIINKYSIQFQNDEYDDFLPHVDFTIPKEQRDKLKNFFSEIGLEALEIMRKDFDNSEDGFWVPEIHYLIYIISDYLVQLGEYEKCVNIISDSNFDEVFMEWSWEEMNDNLDWVYSFIQFMINESFSRGILTRPGFKELVEQNKKIEDNIQKVRLAQMRAERKFDESEKPASIDRTQSSVLKTNPWIDNVNGFGSVVNSENLYEQLTRHDWGQVVMGYCVAVEEELSRFVYDKYLSYRADFSKAYTEESEKRDESFGIFGTIAKINGTPASSQIWNAFVKLTFPEHYEFVYSELPKLVADIKPRRNKSAHTVMASRGAAEKVRILVMGDGKIKGLLERLVALRLHYENKEEL